VTANEEDAWCIIFRHTQNNGKLHGETRVFRTDLVILAKKGTYSSADFEFSRGLLVCGKAFCVSAVVKVCVKKRIP
jgi:hypothetical protein